MSEPPQETLPLGKASPSRACSEAADAAPVAPQQAPCSAFSHQQLLGLHE